MVDDEIYFVRVPQAVKRSGLSRSTFYLMFQRGELRTVKIGRRAVAIPGREFDAWMKSRIARAGDA